MGLLSHFFWKSAKCDEFWIFLPFWLNMLPVWLTNNNKYSGALRKRCLKVNKLKDLIFFNFWPVFWPVLTFFCYFKKIWEGPSEKKISCQNLIFHMQKLIWKPKNIPTLFKKPSWNSGNVRKIFQTTFCLGFLSKVGIFFGFQINFCMWKIRFWP